MPEKPKRIASKLKAIRQHFGVSQTAMKRLLYFDGHYSRLSEYEIGRRMPPLKVLLSYARVAKVPLEQIVDDDLELKLPPTKSGPDA
jgi:transcriptional regulator with XRE-family HTH domain